MKKLSLKKFLQLFGTCTILLGLMLGLVACGGTPATEEVPASTAPAETTSEAPAEDAPSAESLTVGWWGVQDVHDYTLAAGDYYTEQTGIALESTYNSWGDYWQRMTVLAASSDLPDIMRQDYGQFSSYVETGMLAPLDEFIDSGVIDVSNVDPSLIDATRIDGDLYGISVGANAIIAVVNVELVESAGMEIPSNDFTFDEYEAWCIEFAEKTGKFANTLQFYANSTPMFELELRSKGKNIYEDGALGFDEADMVTFLERVKRLHDAKAIPGIDTLAQELNAQDSQFTKGNCAVDTIWSDTADTVANTLGAECAMIPVPGTVSTSANYMKPSQLLSIPTNSEYKEDAAAYINMWTNDSGFNEILAGRRGLPINSEIAAGVSSSLGENTKNVWDCLEVVMDSSSPIAPPWPAGAAEVTNFYKTAVASVCFGELTPQEAAADFMENASNALANA